MIPMVADLDILPMCRGMHRDRVQPDRLLDEDLMLALAHDFDRGV